MKYKHLLQGQYDGVFNRLINIKQSSDGLQDGGCYSLVNFYNLQTLMTETLCERPEAIKGIELLLKKLEEVE